MKKKLLIILGIVLLASGGYYLYSSSRGNGPEEQPAATNRWPPAGQGLVAITNVADPPSRPTPSAPTVKPDQYSRSIIAIPYGQHTLTGFFITADGLAITTSDFRPQPDDNAAFPVHAYPAAAGAAKGQYQAQIIQRPPGQGIAYFKLDTAETFVPLSFGVDELHQPGHFVFTLSHAQQTAPAEQPAPSAGKIISNVNQAIVTDFPLSDQAAGSPLLNDRGCLIGVNRHNQHGFAADRVTPKLRYIAVPISRLDQRWAAQADPTCVPALDPSPMADPASSPPARQVLLTDPPPPTATPFPEGPPIPLPPPPTQPPPPTYTPAPTPTLYPTHTPWPTGTPWPTTTPWPTATLYPTATPQPSPTPGLRQFYLDPRHKFAVNVPHGWTPDQHGPEVWTWHAADNTAQVAISTVEYDPSQGRAQERLAAKLTQEFCPRTGNACQPGAQEFLNQWQNPYPTSQRPFIGNISVPRAPAKARPGCRRYFLSWTFKPRDHESALLIEARVCREAERTTAHQAWDIAASVHTRFLN